MKFKDEKTLMGLKIKAVRKQKGFTQEKFCEVLDIDISGLSKIENGKCFPSTETIFKIIKNLDISPNELFSSSNKNDLQDDLVVEKIKQLSSNDKQKVLKIIQILKS